MCVCVHQECVDSKCDHLMCILIVVLLWPLTVCVFTVLCVCHRYSIQALNYAEVADFAVSEHTTRTSLGKIARSV